MNKKNDVCRTGHLTLDASLGQVTSTSGRFLRLSPVNVKVLGMLVNRPGQVVSRAELFEEVWKNQVVSDDTLTRCISDIRSQLSKTFGEVSYIETLPKRGYRWALAGDDQPTGDTGHQERFPVDNPSTKASSRLRRLAMTAAAYALSTVLLATAVVWITGYLARPTVIRLAVFPTQGPDPSSAVLANQIHRSLSAGLMSRNNLEVLANSAVDSRPQNPFPYFFYEFDTPWVVESQLSRDGTGYRLSVSLVDARTGVVVFMESEEMPDLAKRNLAGLDAGIVADIHDFINTSPGR